MSEQLKTSFPILYRVFVTNFKTSFCALLVVLSIALKVTGKLDREDMTYLIGVAVAGGLFAAKDGVREEKVAREDVPN